MRWWPLALAAAGGATCVALSSLFLVLGGPVQPCDGIPYYWEHERMGPIGAGFVAAWFAALPIVARRVEVGRRGARVACAALFASVGIFVALWRVPWQIVTLEGKHYDDRVPMLYLAWGVGFGVACACVSRSMARGPSCLLGA